MKEYIKSITVIDSGVQMNHSGINNKNINFINLVDNIQDDQLGHGTAICSIIQEVSPNIKINMIKIYKDNFECDIETYIEALELAKQTGCMIINLSNGILYNDKINYLKIIINEITSRNCIIVSAFDNYGAMSYPAAFSNVIGVDSDRTIINDNEFVVTNSEIVNIIGKGGNRKVAWMNSKFSIQSGSSFVSAYISGLIANLILKYGSLNNQEILLKLHNISNNSLYIENKTRNIIPFQIKNAVIYPFCKEVHPFIRYENMLQIKISGIFSNQLSGVIGENAGKYIGGDYLSPHIIKNIYDIDFSTNFDTFILTHFNNSFYENLQNKEIKFITDNCNKYKKNIFCFDDKISEFKDISLDNIYFNKITKKDVPNQFGKLYIHNKPILGIFGTSSRQGKFSVQLQLRKNLLSLGYKIGQIGTEPGSLFFGFDYIYPMGYNSTVEISGYDAVTYINKLINDIEIDKNPDIVIVGSQSGTLPYNTKNLGYINLPQYEFLLGTSPDAIILCMNIFDRIDLIFNTISFFKLTVSAKVIGIVLYPYEKKLTSFKNNFTISKRLDSSSIFKFKGLISKTFSIPCFVLDEECDMNSLTEVVIDYFS